MPALVVIVGLLIAAPAWSQTKVYTNADLGQPRSSTRVTVSPEVLASLAAHQFRLPQTFEGPRVVQGRSSPTSGPFGDYQNTILPRRLDGSLWTEPQWSVSYSPGFYPGFAPYGATGLSRWDHERPASRPRPHAPAR